MSMTRLQKDAYDTYLHTPEGVADVGAGRKARRTRPRPRVEEAESEIPPWKDDTSLNRAGPERQAERQAGRQAGKPTTRARAEARGRKSQASAEKGLS